MIVFGVGWNANLGLDFVYDTFISEVYFKNPVGLDRSRRDLKSLN